MGTQNKDEVINMVLVEELTLITLQAFREIMQVADDAVVDAIKLIEKEENG